MAIEGFMKRCIASKTLTPVFFAFMTSQETKMIVEVNGLQIVLILLQNILW